MIVPARAFGSRARTMVRVVVATIALGAAHAQGERGDDPTGAFAFAVVGTATGGNDRGTQTLLRAIDGDAARFVVHFDLSSPSAESCSDAAMDRRHALLEASVKPVIPVVGASAWSDCGRSAVDPLERLARLGDLFFSSDESLGQGRLPWLRQSAVPRFRRYRENVEWQMGAVLFTTIDLPDNNNNFRLGAGRNGEFEERSIANRAWIERTFRIATERRLAGVVIFVDAAPRFAVPMRAPDPRSSERDGYYEWKLGLREVVPAFKGQVLLVQGRDARGAAAPSSGRTVELDRPLHDAGGRPIANFSRVTLPDAGATRWLRIRVEPRDAHLFQIALEQTFDDPSGELYGSDR